MKKKKRKRLTQRRAAELKTLGELPDHAINTSDAPELSDWSGAGRGMLYRHRRRPPARG